MNQRIVVVDDEAWVVRLVRGYLEQAGFQVATAADGHEALVQIDTFDPALIVLDLMLPGLDGLEITRAVRKKSDVPIIMLTARADEVDRVTGLELGADDYVVKPFSARELVSRVRAVLRRANGETEKSPQIELRNIRIDLAGHTTFIDDKKIDLTPMEFNLLAHFMQYPGQVFTRNQLLDSLLGPSYESFDRSIDAHIKRLRKKIEPDPKEPEYIVTVFGVGYKFEEGVPQR